MDLTSLISQFAGTSGSGMTQVVSELMKTSGGAQGLVEKFSAAGFSDQAKSWLGDGPNDSISGDAIQKVLGAPIVSQFASQLGMDSSSVSGELAKVLPEIINAMSSGGNLTSIASGLLNQIAGGNSAIDSIKKLF